MLVPEFVRKCVAFVGYQLADGVFRLAGTAWFAGREIAGTQRSWAFVVTAKHVIDGIANLGCDTIYVRLNMETGPSKWLVTKTADWWFHPTDSSADVAALRAGIPEGADHLLYPVDRFASWDVVHREGINVGEKVFLTGLFANHAGQQRNIPIVRVGNIAAMPEEPVSTSMGPMEAFLVEARSIGGLSGSPVFVHLGLVRHVDGSVKFAQQGAVFYLLGLMHGHWDVTELRPDTAPDELRNARSVNMGIAIVVPAWKVLEVFEQPKILALQAAEKAKGWGEPPAV